jgi:membrane-associated protein
MWRGCRRFLLPYRSGCFYELALARARSRTRKSFKSSIRREDQHRVLDAILHFFHSLYNPEGLKELIRSGGAPLICTIVFIETGFFVGFFLPGDSLLVTAGVFAALPNGIPLKWLLLPVMFCAIVGDQIGYWIGRSAGAALYRREDSFFFRRSHLQRAHDFYEKYGGRAVILARFIPIVRTFCPPVAGAANMPYLNYVAFDICGGIFWVGAMILGGYSLGRSVPNIGARIHYVIAVVIVASVLPAVISIYRSRHKLGAAGDSGSGATPRPEGQ